MTSADDLITLASADPQEAVARGQALLEDLPESATAERSKTLRAISLGARMSDIGDSLEYARTSAEVARQGGHQDLRLMALLTLSGSMAIGGELTEALTVIDEGLELADDEHIVARFTYQRGALLALLGRTQEAIRAMESVLSIFRGLDDRSSVVLTLNQLGTMSTAEGRLEEAEQHLLEAHELAVDIDDNASLPGILHNLGLLASYRGDIPTALERLQRSDDLYMEISGARAPQHVARSEVLIGVGRFEEAAELASRIAEWNRSSGNREHESNALLVAAQASLLLGDTDTATTLSERAAELLGDDLDAPRAIAARRVGLEARFRADGATRGLLEDAERLCGSLSAEGDVVATAQAHLLAGRIALELGDLDEADRLLRQVSDVGSAPIELRLEARLATALRRSARNDKRGTAMAALSGLRLVDEYQQALGATDLRMGLERHSVELGEIGLGLAVHSKRPRRVLEWMERTRARSLRFRPVIPEEDGAMASLLADLRQVEAGLRRPGNGGDRAMTKGRRQLQEEIAHRDRLRRGVAGEAGRFTVPELAEDLGDASLLEIAESDGRLWGVLVTGGRANLVDIGDAGSARAELRQLRFAMRRAARLGRPFDLSSLERLDALMIGDIRAGGGDIVIVPPPSLMAAPWSALPSLRESVVTISPSAEIWSRATRVQAGSGTVVVAGGPDLDIAGSEVAAVSGLYDEAVVFPPDRSSVGAVTRAIRGAAVAHIACHATFRVENPMFSSLRLSDGDLNVYDIERLSAPPSMVVLSACDSGYSPGRPGEELAGITSALLAMGARSVVASVGLVPDSRATSDLMVRFHRHLIEGMSPPHALAAAQVGMLDAPETAVAAASFLLVGA